MTNSSSSSSGDATAHFDQSMFSDVTTRCRQQQQTLQLCKTDLARTCDVVSDSRNRLAQLQAMSNPYTAAVQQLQRQQDAQAEQLEQQQQEEEGLDRKVGGALYQLMQ
jgi:DNA repair ATPase RecN